MSKEAGLTFGLGNLIMTIFLLHTAYNLAFPDEAIGKGASTLCFALIDGVASNAELV